MFTIVYLYVYQAFVWRRFPNPGFLMAQIARKATPWRRPSESSSQFIWKVNNIKKLFTLSIVKM